MASPCQVAVFIQAVALAHGFPSGIPPLDVSELVLPDFQGEKLLEPRSTAARRVPFCMLFLVGASTGILPRAAEHEETRSERQRSEGWPATDQCVPVCDELVTPPLGGSPLWRFEVGDFCHRTVILPA